MPDDARPDAAAAVHEVIALWPEGPPTVIPNVPPEATYEPVGGPAFGAYFLRNVSEPTLTVYEPAPGAANGSSVIVCPGGGWKILAWFHEGVHVAEWFAARGYTAFLLKYRVSASPADHDAFMAGMAASNGRLASGVSAAKAPKSLADLVRDQALVFARDVAAEDGRRALEIVHAQAAERGLKADKIGMIGFSAGAFLIADVAVDPRGPSPAFLAPIYGGETRGRPVPADAPPLFTVIAHDDRWLFHMVERLYLDWSAADISSELHIFARGAHGFGLVKQGLPSDRWIELLGSWLADKGFG